MKYYVIMYRTESGYLHYTTYARNKTEAKRNFKFDIGSQYEICDIEEHQYD